MRKFWICTLLLSACLGCTPAVERTGSPSASTASTLDTEPYDCVMVLPIDVSGSMASLMKPGAKGLEFANTAINTYFHSRLGNNDLLVVSQLSGNRQAVVWQGAPRSLREDFSKFGDLGDAVLSQSNSAGSRIWDGLSDSLEIVMTDPRCWNDRTKVVLIVLSDMENTLIDSYSSERRLKDNLKALSKHGGICGLYFVSNEEVVRWRKNMREAGFKDHQYVVEPRAESKPRLPSFE